MNFWQLIIVTFTGSFLGFLGALVIFWIQDYLKKNKLDKAIVDNLKLELKYNINTYTEYINVIQECMDMVTNNRKDVSLNLRSDYLSTHFSRKFYQSGLLLTEYPINRFNYKSPALWKQPGNLAYRLGLCRQWPITYSNRFNRYRIYGLTLTGIGYSQWIIITNPSILKVLSNVLNLWYTYHALFAFVSQLYHSVITLLV